MSRKISDFIIFFIFLGAFGILLFFNYKSYTSTNKLIKNNDELIEELELSSNIQFFQTHLVLLDKYMVESIASGKGNKDSKIIIQLSQHNVFKA